MSVTQFAMVEELAFLIKDNLPCKHLVLSLEQALVNYLQEDASLDEMIELEPMSSYNRLLLHRLAEIFGFSHESVGEGDDRHLVLKRCADTSIPSILVSDILWQQDGFEYSTVEHQLLVRTDVAGASGSNIPKGSSRSSLQEREEAYLAARERIFSSDGIELREAARERPRHVPVVARRMIAHALGQRINPCTQGTDRNYEVMGADKDHNPGRNQVDLSLQPDNCPETITRSIEKLTCLEAERTDPGSGASPNPGVLEKLPGKEPSVCVRTAKDRLGGSVPTMKEENIGAAKRMFAHALGMQSARGGGMARSRQVKNSG